jgi:hypothetical protein
MNGWSEGVPFQKLESYFPSQTSSSTSELKRINMSDMNTAKFAITGALFIVGLDTILFPLNTIQTILMSQRVCTNN